MNRADIEKLLGGYATGTLTSEEQQALFAAALDDQELFDALAREQSLRDLLSDPAAKARLLAVLGDAPVSWYRLAGRWIARPVALGIAAACIAGMAGLFIWLAPHSAQERTLVAEVKQPEPPPPPAPASAPEPQAAVARTHPRARKAAAAPVQRKETFGALAPPSPPEPARENSALRQGGALAGIGGGVGGGGGRGGRVAEPVTAPQAALAGLRMQAFAASGALSRGIRYSVLRKRDDGEFVEADPADLHTGDTLELRLTPIEDGYITVPEREITDARVERSKPFDTPPFTAEGAGSKEFSVIFSREAGAPATTPPALKITLNYK